MSYVQRVQDARSISNYHRKNCFKEINVHQDSSSQTSLEINYAQGNEDNCYEIDMDELTAQEET